MLTLASCCSIFLFHIRLWAFSLQIKKYTTVFSQIRKKKREREKQFSLKINSAVTNQNAEIATGSF